MNRTLTLALIGCLAATSIAFAQPGDGAAGSGPDAARGPRGVNHFARLDADGNGSVSLSELRADMRSHFGKADTNKDGKVTTDELKARHEAKRAEWKAKHGSRDEGEHAHRKHGGDVKHFDLIDTNDDGVISQSEIDRAAAERFAKLDQNGDKQVTLDEMRRGHHRGPGRNGHCGHES